MGICQYCGKPAGWFRSAHKLCSELDIQRRAAAQKKAEEGRKALASRATANAEGQESEPNLESVLQSIASEAGLASDDVREALYRGFEYAAERCIAEESLSHECEDRLIGFARAHSLSQEALDRHLLWTKLCKLALLRDLQEGHIPERAHVIGDVPFVLGSGERVIWLFNDVRCIKAHIVRGDVHWKLEGVGVLAVTTSNLLFAGGVTSVRIPLSQIVTLEESHDGLRVSKGSQKPLAFIFEDKHFAVSLVRALTEICLIGPKRRSSQISPDAVHTSLVSEGAWPQLPLFPNSEQPVSVPSQSHEGSYTVSLSAYTCTCADWLERRAGYPGRDVRRTCKHIARELLNKNFENGVIRALLGVGGCPPYTSMRIYAIAEHKVHLFHIAGSEWVDVVACPRGVDQYRRFGYNLNRNYWSYGQYPANATAIKQLLTKWSG